MISVHFQGKQFDITVIQVYAPTTYAEEVEVEQFCEDLQDPLELTPKRKKKVIFSNHPTLTFSHRVQKSVLYICVSISVLHIGLLLPSF